MKNPGPIGHGTRIHKAMVEYTKAVAAEFQISEPAVLGQLLKLHEAMSKAADSDEGMSNLVISNKGDT